MDPFDPSTFTETVTSFKAFFKNNPDLYRVGQFYITQLVTKNLIAALSADIANDPCVISSTSDGGKSVIDAISSQLNNPSPGSDDLSVIGPWLTDPAKVGGCDLSQYWQQYFQPASPTASDQAQAQVYFNSVWKSESIDGPPAVALSPTYKLLTAVHQLEQVSCFDVATGMASKLLVSQGVKPSIARSISISSGLVGLACVIASGSPTSTATLQLQNVRYQNSSDLANTVVKMGKVLKAGGVLRCGVVSGVRDDKTSKPLLPCTVRYPPQYLPDPEHYLLIFAQGIVSDLTAFLFWDPDAGVTRFGSLDWGSGFGCLFSQGGRLSTAFNDSDLVAVNTQVNNDFQGDHTNPPPTFINRRHRYQVYSVASLPVTSR